MRAETLTKINKIIIKVCVGLFILMIISICGVLWFEKYKPVARLESCSGQCSIVHYPELLGYGISILFIIISFLVIVLVTINWNKADE